MDLSLIAQERYAHDNVAISVLVELRITPGRYGLTDAMVIHNRPDQGEFDQFCSNAICSRPPWTVGS